MFGSNFLQNFGIPNWQDFPLQGTDAQGGMFGYNMVPTDQGGGGDMMTGIPGGPASATQLPQANPASPAQPQQQGTVTEDAGPMRLNPLGPGGGTPLAQPQPDMPITQPFDAGRGLTAQSGGIGRQ